MVIGEIEWGNAAEWAGSIATTAAVVVALIVAFLPSWQEQRHRPKLELRCGADAPWTRVAKVITEVGAVGRVIELGSVCAFLRVEVLNTGSSEAHNVQVVATRWCVRVEGESPEWQELDIDPSELHWVTLSHAPHTPSAVIALPTGSRNFVDVCRVGQGALQLLPHDPRPRGFAFDSPWPACEHRLELQVWSSNADTIVRAVRFVAKGVITDRALGETPGFEVVEFCELPPANAIKPISSSLPPASHHQS